MLQYLSAQKEHEREEKKEKHCSHNYNLDYFKDFLNLHYPEINWWLNYGVTLYVKNTFDDFFSISSALFFEMEKRGIGIKIWLSEYNLK